MRLRIDVTQDPDSPKIEGLLYAPNPPHDEMLLSVQKGKTESEVVEKLSRDAKAWQKATGHWIQIDVRNRKPKAPTP